MFVSFSQPICLLLFVILLGYAVYPVKHQLLQRKVQHLVFGTAAALSVLWWFRTGIYPGLEIHFLWLSAASMVVGWRWAIFSSAIALVVMVAVGLEAWQDLGIVGLFGCAAPILTTFTIYSLTYHRLPKNFFVYVFANGFFAGALCIALKMALLASVSWFNQEYDFRILSENYLILIPLLLFPEGLLNGMTLTLMSIYKPNWVATFYDRQYFNN